jgi:hypothetical protein
LYGTRFIDFMKAAIRGISPVLTEDQNKKVSRALAVPSGSFIQKS